MFKFYGQKVNGSNLYFSFNSNYYYKKVVCQKDRHEIYKYFTNDLFVVEEKTTLLELNKLCPCTKNLVKVDLKMLTELDLGFYNIHCFLEKYLRDNNLNFYHPWWLNKNLNNIINDKLKCLNIK